MEKGTLVSGVAKNAGAIAFVATSSNERGNAVTAYPLQRMIALRVVNR
jgi:hypothetical protein